MKVRVVLGYKGIHYTFHTIDPADRSEIFRISGQHLVPILSHAGRVVFDSGAILRYLDGAFPNTPKLFGESLDEQHQIEAWEHFGRGELAAPLIAIVRMRRKGEEDPGIIERGGEKFAKSVSKVVDQMAARDWLVGDRLTAADATIAPVIWRVVAGQILPEPPVLESLRPWITRVMAYDAGP